MLSRGKLVQDWRQRLAAAEAEGAEQHRLKWLYRMRVRLYRYLLSCYPQGDWRADAPSIAVDETLADVLHGDTTTILDCPLDGKPAKTSGKMLAVLKSVSAAQDHPAKAGPLLGGIAADDWVVAVSVRDKLKMAGCQELLRQFGIVSKWTVIGEIKVRLFDLERASQIVRKHREALKIKATHALSWSHPSLFPPTIPVTSWPIRLAILILFLAPIYALFGVLLIQCVLVTIKQPIMKDWQIVIGLAIGYVATAGLGIAMFLLRDERRRRNERQEARQLADEDRKMPGPTGSL